MSAQASVRMKCLQSKEIFEVVRVHQMSTVARMLSAEARVHEISAVVRARNRISQF